MQVKLLVGRGGSMPDGGQFTQNPGDIIDVDDAVGQRMIDTRQAEPVSKPKPEKRKQEAK